MQPGFQVTATPTTPILFCFSDYTTQRNRKGYQDMAGVSGKLISSSSGVKREDVMFYDEKKKKKYRMGKFLGKVFAI